MQISGRVLFNPNSSANVNDSANIGISHVPIVVPLRTCYLYYISWSICYDQLEYTTSLYAGLALNGHLIEESISSVSFSIHHPQHSTLVGSALVQVRASNHALSLFFSAHKPINICTASFLTFSNHKRRLP